MLFGLSFCIVFFLFVASFFALGLKAFLKECYVY